MNQQTRALLEKAFPGLHGKVEQSLHQNMVTIVPTYAEIDEIFWFLLANISIANVPYAIVRFSKNYAKRREKDPQLPVIYICGKVWEKINKEMFEGK